MSFTAVGTLGDATANGFTLTPPAGVTFILLGVLAGFPTGSSADYATGITNSGNVTWSVLVAHTAFTASVGAETLFLGKVNNTSGEAQTITFNAGSPQVRVGWQPFSNTGGYSAVTFDASGTVDVGSSAHFPSVTPGHGSGELYWSYLWDNGTGTAGSTSGYTYQFDANGNPMAYNTSCGSGAQAPNIGDTGDGVSGIAALLYEAVASVSGAAALSGSGTLTASGKVVVPAAAALSGSGTLTPTAAVAIPAAVFLLGTGSLTASGGYTAPGQVSANLAGSGTLTTAIAVGWAQAATLSGSGTLTATYTGLTLQGAVLSGSGALTVAVAQALKFTAGLFGAGFLSIPQVAGGLVNGVGGASVPQALPGSSQVAVAPPGSSNWQWLGTLGQVTALTYSYVCPGGCDQMTCTVLVPAAYRTALFDPGWQVKITRGGHQVWYGKMDEPQPSAQGWTLSAVGAGNLGTNFVSFYSPDDVFPAGEPDEIINRAIARGLPWSNAGLDSSPYFSQFWFGQATDPGSTTVTDFLNLICTRGGLTWYVDSQPGGLYGGNNLNVFPLPTTPNRLLVCTSPVARTLGGYVNAILIRLMTAADNTTANTPAEFSVVSAINYQSQAAHGPLEAYLDLSNAGVLTPAQALAVGENILQIYQAASFSGPFTVSYGQLLNVGGQAVDIGTDQSGPCVRLVLTDAGYGGEVVPGEVTFTVGSYSYDDFAGTAQIGPYQELDASLSGLLSMTSTVMTPLTVTGG